MTTVMPPADGVAPNLEGWTSVQVAFLIVNSIFLALASGFLGLRLYTSLCIVRRFGVEDGKSPATSAHSGESSLT